MKYNQKEAHDHAFYHPGVRNQFPLPVSYADLLTGAELGLGTVCTQRHRVLPGHICQAVRLICDHLHDYVRRHAPRACSSISPVCRVEGLSGLDRRSIGRVSMQLVSV